MIYVQYQYVTWNPPTLTEEQEVELGRQIALVGRDHFVREFRLENGLPIWTYEAEGFVIGKRLLLVHGQSRSR